jgi:hypothetical protein
MERTNPGRNRGSSAADTSNDTPSLDEFNFDRQIVDRVDQSIWHALFNGDFRLAVRCDTCGRWLTSSASKRAHRGPRCSARAGDTK